MASIYAYVHDQNAMFGLQGFLWLGSMALLVLSCARWYPRLDNPKSKVQGPKSVNHTLNVGHSTLD